MSYVFFRLMNWPYLNKNKMKWNEWNDHWPFSPTNYFPAVLLYLQSSLLDLRLQWQHFTHKLRQKLNGVSYHLFSLIVEDHRLWFVDAKYIFFDASSWSTRGEIDWEVKVVIICLRHKVFLQSQKFGHRLFIWNTVGFCCIAPSPPLKRVK